MAAEQYKTKGKGGGAELREKADLVLESEVRSWLTTVLDGLEHDSLALLKTAANPVDALRNGALLHYLLCRLRDPTKPFADMKKPRTMGFLARDTIVQFVKAIETDYGLNPVVLFDGSDLVDAQNDRRVVTCLLALARAVADKGGAAAELAPSIVRFEKEIEQQQGQLAEADVDAAIAEAEAAAEEAADDDCATPEPESEPTPTEAEAPPPEREAPAPEPVAAPEAVVAAQPEPAPEPVAEPVPVAPEPAPVQPEEAQPAVAYEEQPADDGGAAAKAKVKQPTALGPVSSGYKYRSLRTDKVDQQVGRHYNKLLAECNQEGRPVNMTIARLRNTGEYVLYHKVTGKRTVVYVRELQECLMIRVGGGWEAFTDYLARRMVDFDEAAVADHSHRLNRPAPRFQKSEKRSSVSK